jgi:hypothetical protein
MARGLGVPIGPRPAPVRDDGVFGDGTKILTKNWQRANGLVDDGRIGRITARRIWKPYFLWFEAVFGIPGSTLQGMAWLESSQDTCAQGEYDNRDRGLLQYNARWHPDVPDEKAYGDPVFCIERAAREFRQALDGLNGNLHAAIASHNNRVKGLEWARTGQAPDEQIEDYVLKVRDAADLMGG